MLSTNLEDIVRTSDILVKRRKRKIDLDNLISDLDNLSFIVLYQQHIDTFGVNSVKVPVITKLTESYSDVIDIKKTALLIDGCPLPSVQEDIHKIFSKTYGKISKSQIQFIDEADKYYKVVNAADSIAYQLNRAYKDVLEGKKGPFDSRRISFQILGDSKKEKRQKYVRNFF